MLRLRSILSRLLRWRWRLALFICASLPLLSAFRRFLSDPSAVIGPTGLDPFFNLYILEWGARSWAHGLHGFWSAPFYFPTHLATTLSDHLLIPSLLQLALRTMGASPALSYNLLLLLGFLATAFACTALLRRATRCPEWVAVALGLAVTYAPWRWGQLTHFQMLWAPGPPLALLTFDALLRRPSLARAGRFVVAYLVALGAGSYLGYFTHLALGVMAVTQMTRQRSRARWLAKWRVALATAAICGIAALGIYYPYVASRSALGIERSQKEIEEYGARASDWLAPSSMNRYSRFVPRTWIQSERNLFPGVLLTGGLLFGLGLAAARKGTGSPMTLLARSLLWIGLLFMMLSSARVFVAAAGVLPGLDGMRVPTRGQLFVLLGLATISALALKSLGARLVGSSYRRALLGLSCFGLLIPDLAVIPLPPETVFRPENAELLSGASSVISKSPAKAIAVFPIDGGEANLKRMWRALHYGRPIANGYSGYHAPTFRYLRHVCRSPGRRITPRCISALRELGVDGVLVEDSFRELDNAAPEARVSASVHPRSSPHLELVYSDRESLFFLLRPEWQPSAPQAGDLPHLPERQEELDETPPRASSKVH